jgi:altronate hydrolase
MKRTLRIHYMDNMEVALTDLKKDDLIDVADGPIHLLSDVAAKHKFALKDLKSGDDIIMYGVLVGKATTYIQKGEIISMSNVQHASDVYKLGERKTSWTAPDISKWKDRTFLGYHRSDGSVGIANHWLLIPMVFCENKNVSVIHEALIKELDYHADALSERSKVAELVNIYRSGGSDEDILQHKLNINDQKNNNGSKIFPNVTGIKLLNHTMGCGGTKDDTRALCGLLAGYITNPNVAGATILSLGCQNAQPDILKEEIAKRDANFSKPLLCSNNRTSGTKPYY